MEVFDLPRLHEAFKRQDFIKFKQDFLAAEDNPGKEKEKCNTPLLIKRHVKF